MAVLKRKIIHKIGTSCSHIFYPDFVLPRHMHAEYEIMLFTAGAGKQFVGEGVADFRKGDVVLIGSNVPHLHLCNSRIKNSGETSPCSGEALQFLPDIFPPHMENLPDYQNIFDLLRKSRHGIRFYQKGLFEELLSMFRNLDSFEYTERLIYLFKILDRLSKCPRTKLLSDDNKDYSDLYGEMNEPVNKVYTYLFAHFKEKIKLKEVAAYVKQNPSALCRYFKKRTDKSIFQCLREIRIGYACRLLAYSDLSVSQIAYESGYDGVSHFILQFEKTIGRTPGAYRLQINVPAF